MRNQKKARLQATGWRVGSAAEFLGLSAEEAAFVELKLALAESLRRKRGEKGLTQAGLASLLGSSQPRVAKMEAGDRSVTIDLLIRALLAVGVTRRELARIVDAPGARRAAQKAPNQSMASA